MHVEKPFVFRDPVWFDSLDSTNTHLRAEHMKKALSSGTVIAARTQTNGRGRMGNAWFSPPRGDLTFSFLWIGEKPFDELGGLSTAVALGAGDWLGTMGVETLCKWPNDVMTANGKICGIIAETFNRGGSVSVVVGMGVNVVASEERTKMVGQPVAALEDELGRIPGAPEALLPELLECLELRIAAWEGVGFAAIHGDAARRLWGIGKRVEIREGNRRRRGTVVGIDERGGLVLAENGGEFRVVSGIVGLEGELP